MPSAFNEQADTKKKKKRKNQQRGSRGSVGEERERNKKTLLKPFICNVSTPVAHQGSPLWRAGLALGTNLQFLTSVDKPSQRVSFPRGQRESVPRKATHQPCPCRVSKNANTLQVNSFWNTMEVWGDKTMK